MFFKLLLVCEKDVVLKGDSDELVEEAKKKYAPLSHGG
jgi:hypothetical protein